MPIENEALLEAARSALPDAVALRRSLHEHPELGLELPETARRVKEALAPLGLAVRESKRSSSFVARVEGEAGSGPRVMLRADMDALPMPEDTGLSFASCEPGRMHACGHDAHTAMLVAAAGILHERRRDFSGSIDLFFQAGEEGHFGARVAIEDGLFDGADAPDAAFAIHIEPRMRAGRVSSRPGPVMAAADVWRFELEGRGGHASMPHDTRDPIPVACEIVQALQSFVARRANAFDPIVLSTTKIEAGTTDNVIPESARALGTLRSFSPKARAEAHEGIERIIHNIAAAHEVDAKMKIFPGYPVTINDASFEGFARETTRSLLGERNFVEMPSPAMGAEDFSYVLERWPGAMFFLGVRPEDPKQAAPCHSNRMMLNEDGMENGIALHAAIALRYLAEGSTPARS